MRSATTRRISKFPFAYHGLSAHPGLTAKELTLKNLDLTKIDKDKLEYLKDNLGDLGYIHKKRKMATLFKSDPELVLEFIEYEIIRVTDSSVTIKNHIGSEVTFTYEGNCYYLSWL